MAKQTTKSSVLGKLGPKAKAAFDQAKTEEMVPDTGGRLPGGIEGGIAQLVTCKFDVFKKGDNKGQPYFIAAGIVKAPKEHNGIPLVGRRTSLSPIALCDTKNSAGKVTTLAEHVAEVLNYFKRLGVDTSDLEFDQWEDTAAELEATKPHFRFRTSEGAVQTSGPYKGKPARVFENWGEFCEYDDANDEDAVVDETATDDDGDDSDTDSASDAPTDLDLDALAKSGDKGNAKAQQTLKDAAAEVGIDADEYDTWADVVEAMRAAESGSEAETEEAEDEEEFVPELKNIYLYKRADGKKPTEHEVIAIAEEKGTCTVKDVATKKITKGVAYPELTVTE
jgi:hypothetical protein